VRLLLDTHVFLWWRSGKAMRQHVMDAIRGADEVFVSAASGWEVAIKAAAGKLRLSASFAEGVADSEFEPLPITLEHAALVAELPFHHRDPFDRLLLAQARAERLTFVTADRELERYGGPFLWV
jgi:PIN domain nuclease of toxin-antitoxin system